MLIILNNIRINSFLESHLVCISVFKLLLGQKLRRKLQIPDTKFGIFPLFQLLTSLSTFFGMFCAQLFPTNLLNL